MPVNERSLIGQEVAGYQVEEIVGRGGMAVVYLAIDTRLDRRVALKILHPALSADDRFRQRFVLESRMVAGIDHPNIIPIYEASADGELLYIAMRYVAGMDMRRLFLDRGPLEISQVNQIFAQVAAALDTAHAHDLIHRDVKPANILIAGGATGEHVYLTDFGITKHQTSISGLTKTDQFIGTPRYMAPEQINKDRVDGRCDQYALACVVYEALAGRLPFQRDNDIALLWAHLAETPAPLSGLRPELPLGVDGVMARALAKSPDQRYPSCADFVAELRDAIDGRAVPVVAGPTAPAPAPADPAPATQPSPVPAGGRRGNRGIIVAAAAAVALIVAVAAVLAVLLRGGESEWTRYAGSAAAPLRFDHPGDWVARTHTDVFTVASPHGAAFERLFVTPVSADWSEANRLLRDDPETATGLFVQVLDTLDPNAGVQDLQETLRSSLPGTVSITSGIVQVPVGGRPAVRIEGTLADPQGGGNLDLIGYAVDRPGAAALLVYFCAPGTCRDDVAQRIAGSVELRPS
ncbi:serine/threonine protein kinase [Spongiactinospora rosea]|uniref:non-specific serine/threonine protein kinase n=1 Tax=Spongiactinospora rosea TaxID=2248750 RepID=A0A366M3Z7_9ACTN|nr:serine/threonine-protein kinase [Spongiactinospora rosea]RBQ20152.1 serine/threonine protein kinase [Spongiactinospora rosea]